MATRFQRVLYILNYLNQPNKVVKRNFVNFLKLMGILHHPHKSFKSIHITGTNGKGPVAIKTAKVLQNAGYKTGIYTSPHLFSFRERIQVNGYNISRDDISKHIVRINYIAKEEQIYLSYFEYLTATGFLHFQEQQCDFVSLEVGIGGNNDTTNIITPYLSVITSIGLDHVEYLGPTEEHIAKEKAGIIKNGRPVVLGPAAQSYVGIEYAIKYRKCEVFRVDPKYKDTDFELENNLTVLKCIYALRCYSKIEVTENDIEKGLEAKQPCRMELLDSSVLPKKLQDKKVYFDVGHNPSALKKVKYFVKHLGYKTSEISFVFGTSSKKNIAYILPEIEQVAGQIYLISPDHYRGMPIENLQAYIGQSKNPHKYRCISDGKIDKTLSLVIADPTCKVVIVSGSFFIMTEARGFFEPKLVYFPYYNLNEIYQLVLK